MELSLSRLKNLFGGSTGRRVRLRMSREGIVVYGIFAALFLFAALLIWDGYLFYRMTVRKDNQEIFLPPSFPFSENQVDEVIRLLNEREEKFQALLGVTPTLKQD